MYCGLSRRMQGYHDKHCHWNLNFSTYTLFAGWAVRVVKNCDLGLENAARGRKWHVYFFLQ